MARKREKKRGERNGTESQTSKVERLQTLLEEAREVSLEIRRRQQTELMVLAELEETLESIRQEHEDEGRE